MEPESRRIERCRFLGLADRGERSFVVLEGAEGRRFEAELLNPDTLRGDLPFGAEIAVALCDDVAGRLGAELLIAEEERLGPELKSILASSWSSPLGLLRKSPTGYAYLHLAHKADGDLCLTGELLVRGFTAIVSQPADAFLARPRWLDRAAEACPPFPLRILSWLVEGAPGDEACPELRAADLQQGRWEGLAADLSHSLYWAEGFDPAFYRLQARRGCIAVALDRGDRVFLMPELQEAYAVLDWENLRRSRSLSRLFRSGRLKELGLRLVCNPDPGPILEALAERWGEESWLYPEYRGLMLALAREPRKGLKPWGVELRAGEGGLLVAGELGYSIGRTYTSISGFRRREPEWSDLGKVQLHLLAALLEERGYAFWNLGHPRMQYKLDLGARVLDRRSFLERWERAVAEEDPGLEAAPRGRNGGASGPSLP